MFLGMEPFTPCFVKDKRNRSDKKGWGCQMHLRLSSQVFILADKMGLYEPLKSRALSLSALTLFTVLAKREAKPATENKARMIGIDLINLYE